MAGGYVVKLEGGEALSKLLNGEKLLNPPLKDLLKAVGMQGKAAAKQSGPRRSGKLVSSVSYRVASKPVWVRVDVTAKRGSVSYPRILEFSAKHHHKSWFKNTVEKEVGNLRGLLNDCAKAIEGRWKS